MASRWNGLKVIRKYSDRACLLYVNWSFCLFVCLFCLSVFPPTHHTLICLLARGIPGRVIFETTGLNHIARDFQWLTRRKHAPSHGGTPRLRPLTGTLPCFFICILCTHGQQQMTTCLGCAAAGLNPHVNSECVPCSQWLSSAATGLQPAGGRKERSGRDRPASAHHPTCQHRPFRPIQRAKSVWSYIPTTVSVRV